MSDIFVGLLGDKVDGYIPHESAEKAMLEIRNKTKFSLHYEWLSTDQVSKELLKKYDCIWAGSGPYLNEEKALAAIKYARENKIPILGTCSGFKYMVIEYAKNVFNASNPFNYIDKNQLCSTDYKELTINLEESSSLVSVFNSTSISEISHCTFEIASEISQKTAEAFEFCGKAKDDGRTVLIRLPNHSFYVASLFLPQLKDDSKLIIAWLKMALEVKMQSSKLTN